MIRIFSLMLALTACQKAPPNLSMSISAADRMLQGSWRSDGGMIATIGAVSGETVVTSLVDYDDEVFVVLTSGWEEAGFSMHYEVPSTKYLVTIRLTDIQQDALQYAWNNTTPEGNHNEGTGYFERVQ
jgi:hypothetical protein